MAIRGIVDRLHTASCSLHSSATDTGPTTGSGSGVSTLEQIMDSCVAVLFALSSSCPHGLIAVTRDIVEVTSSTVQYYALYCRWGFLNSIAFY